ncbi:MAG: 30S ribosomal protein S6 [Parachlamydiales bacterium]|jgi:small subunit ribosomal protein S6|nr:30S ribosomal protein S6 [Candidatus Acheromyda pituitae]
MAKQRSHLYEGMYILSATLSDDARQKALDKITSSIEGRGGEIHKTFDNGRKKLAYEINGRREGYYYLLYFSVPTAVMTEMWKEYHLNEDLLRFMTLRTEKVPEKIEFKPLIQE